MTMTPIESDGLTRGKHGFFTCKGGVSTGIYASLNCGAGSGDDAGAVTENRARVAGWFGLAGADLISTHQVHSAEVVTVRAPFEGSKPQCDGMVTDQPGLILGALSADCAPVLFEDRTAGVIGACHAGWRGALSGICEATVAAMEDLGARAARIQAAVGPCLSQRNYEVGPEFFDSFTDEDPDHASYFANGQGDRLQFDLPRFVLDRLRASGVGHAEWIGHCTYGDPDRFFSYRRSCHENLGDYGRLISAITL